MSESENDTKKTRQETAGKEVHCKSRSCQRCVTPASIYHLQVCHLTPMCHRPCTVPSNRSPSPITPGPCAPRSPPAPRWVCVSRYFTTSERELKTAEDWDELRPGGAPLAKGLQIYSLASFLNFMVGDKTRFGLEGVCLCVCWGGQGGSFSNLMS